MCLKPEYLEGTRFHKYCCWQAGNRNPGPHRSGHEPRVSLLLLTLKASFSFPALFRSLINGGSRLPVFICSKLSGQPLPAHMYYWVKSEHLHCDGWKYPAKIPALTAHRGKHSSWFIFNATFRRCVLLYLCCASCELPLLFRGILQLIGGTTCWKLNLCHDIPAATARVGIVAPSCHGKSRYDCDMKRFSVRAQTAASWLQRGPPHTPGVESISGQPHTGYANTHLKPTECLPFQIRFRDKVNSHHKYSLWTSLSLYLHLVLIAKTHSVRPQGWINLLIVEIPLLLMYCES